MGDMEVAQTRPVLPGEERTCPNCGAANDAEALFCTSCGEKLA
jgi:hypothetical protein